MIHTNLKPLAAHTVRPKFTIGELQHILAFLPQTSTLYSRIELMVRKVELEVLLGTRKDIAQPGTSALRETPADLGILLEGDSGAVPASPAISNDPVEQYITLPLVMHKVPETLQKAIFKLLVSDDPGAASGLDTLLSTHGYSRDSLGLPTAENQNSIAEWYAMETGNLGQEPSIADTWDRVFLGSSPSDSSDSSR